MKPCGKGLSILVDLLDSHVAHNCPLVSLHRCQAYLQDLQEDLAIFAVVLAAACWHWGFDMIEKDDHPTSSVDLSPNISAAKASISSLDPLIFTLENNIIILTESLSQSWAKFIVMVFFLFSISTSSLTCAVPTTLIGTPCKFNVLDVHKKWRNSQLYNVSFLVLRYIISF